MKKLDVLAIGELNVDLILNDIDGEVEVGKEKLAGDMSLTLGSSTAIFASNLSSLGANVGFLGKIGVDAFGEFVTQKLEEKGIDTSLVMADMNLSTGATIVLNYGEDRAMVTHPGAMDFLSLKDITDDHLSRARHIHFSSLFLQPGLKKDIHQLFSRAKKLGVTTSLDTQWDPSEKWEFDFEAILPFVDVFLPNETELLHLTKATSIEEAIKKLEPFMNNMAVKRGNKGSVLYQPNKELVHHSGYLNTQVVDAIGAGDSFNAGFICKYVKGASPEACLDFANLTGALNTTAVGGTGAFASPELIRSMALNKFNISIDL
ncbi:carbohydrate kinase family protein [Thermophagus sp. OGC60D27]|uniref:carbohydrate kinase family protein n=1 Tax=Thermophagus sp. OGC60D27 TaxID=3458415 RepID=UPI00403802EE